MGEFCVFFDDGFLVDFESDLGQGSAARAELLLSSFRLAEYGK